MFLKHIELDDRLFYVDKILELQDYYEVTGNWLILYGNFAMARKQENIRIHKDNKINWLVSLSEDRDEIKKKGWRKL